MKFALCLLVASCGMQLAQSQDFLSFLPAIRGPQIFFPPGFQTVPLATLNNPGGANPAATPDINPLATGDLSGTGPRSERQTQNRTIRIGDLDINVVVPDDNNPDNDNPDGAPQEVVPDDNTVDDEPSPVTPTRPRTTRPRRIRPIRVNLNPPRRPSSRPRRIRPIRVNVRNPKTNSRPRRIRPILLNVRPPTSFDAPSGGYGGYGQQQSKPSYDIVRANRIGHFELDSPSGYQGQSQFSNGNFPSLTNTAPGDFPLINADPEDDQFQDEPEEELPEEELPEEELPEEEEPEDEEPATTRRPPRRLRPVLLNLRPNASGRLPQNIRITIARPATSTSQQ